MHWLICFDTNELGHVLTLNTINIRKPTFYKNLNLENVHFVSSLKKLLEV